MKGPELALVLAAAACAPTSGKIDFGETNNAQDSGHIENIDDTGDSGTDLPVDGCSVGVSLSEYPNPLIQHADINPETDVLNTVLITAANLGDTLCPEMELRLSHDGTDYTQTLPELESGEVIQLTQKGIILNQSGAAEFTVALDGESVSVQSLDVRDVGSVLKAQMAQYILEHQGLVVTECEGDATNQVPEYSSYCDVMQEATNQGWYTGNYPGGLEYEAINMAEFATTLMRAYPELDLTGVEWESPCDSSAWDDWYKYNLEVVSARFPDNSDYCDPNGAVFTTHVDQLQAIL